MVGYSYTSSYTVQHELLYHRGEVCVHRHLLNALTRLSQGCDNLVSVGAIRTVFFVLLSEVSSSDIITGYWYTSILLT